MAAPTRRPLKQAIAPVNGRDHAPFPLGTWRNPETDEIEPRMVEIYDPDETDMFVITRVQKLIEQAERTQDGQLTMTAMGHFGDLIDSMFVEPEDRRYALDMLIAREVSPTEYADVVLAAVKHFKGEPDEAPRTGPPATKRAARSRR